MMKVDLPSEVVLLGRGDAETTHRADVYGKSLDRLGVRAEYASSPQRLTHVNDAILETISMSPMESFRFAGAGGTVVQGFIIRPPGFDAARKYPLKFLIHGGPQGAWGRCLELSVEC